MAIPGIGSKAPGFSLATDSGGEMALSDLKGKPVCVFFYPKADTPGCTTEATEFTQRRDEFNKMGVQILGISADPVSKLAKFKEKRGLGITLLSDEGTETLQAYGVWVEKSMYGKTYMGIERTTLLIDGDGKIVEEWRKVKVKGHVDAVLESAKAHFG